MYFLLFLIGFFVAEVFVMSAVADSLGFWPVLGLLFLGLMIGGYLINRQGRLTGSMFTAYGPHSGSQDALGVIFNLLSGLLFIFPGFISDALALLLLLPPVRLLLLGLAGHLLLTRLASRVNRMQAFTFGRMHRPGGFGPGASANGPGASDDAGGGRPGSGSQGNAGNSASSGFPGSDGSGNWASDYEDTVIEGEFRDVTAEMERRKEQGGDALSLETEEQRPGENCSEKE